MLDEGTTRGDALARVEGRGTAAPRPSGLTAGFLALVLLTYGLIVLGALVRAHGAGLACPDWPLCFGEFVPAMDLKVAFEWSHRVVAGTVALSFAALAFWGWRITGDGDRLRPLFVLAAVLLLVQIVLGALTVWELLASWTVTSHLLVGNSIVACFAWIGWELRDRNAGAPAAAADVAAHARRWLWVVGGLLLLQMFLGGQVSSRYAGLACPEWPTCNGGLWFPTWQGTVGIHLLHRLNGYALLGVLLGWAATARGTGRLAWLARLAGALGLAQVAVGIANVVLALPVEVTGLHSALATALVLTATLAVRDAWFRHA
ncbi:MAG: COX15/CtaA family protein [Myxococcota bacterium]